MSRVTKKNSGSAFMKFAFGIFLIAVSIIGVLYYWDKRDTKPVSEIIEDTIVGEEGKVYTVTVSDLERVVRRSQLYTAEYDYNGCVEVKTKDNKTKYYVAYEGKVKAGIDVQKVTVKLDEDTNTITVYLPEVEVENPTVDAGTMEYIFENKKYDTETVAQEAYKKAIEDLTNRVKCDRQIVESARENAKVAEKALLEPWLNQIDPEKKYTVIVMEQAEGGK